MKENIQLNPQQKEVVTYESGPLLIIAGAGTGKTTVITERIKWLIQEKNLKPEQILALTFTEKAAFEMEERVDVALPLGYTRTWIMTFHSFCERVLRQEAIQIGLDPNFKILSEAETQLFIRDHLFDFDLEYFRPQGNPAKFVGGLVTHFSRLKDEDVSVEDYLNFANSKFEIRNSKFEDEELRKYKELAGAYRKYEELKVTNSVMDFADLISNTTRLFRKRPNVLREYQQKFHHVLIDEFQDTNYAQNHLAILLAGDDQGITAVADDDQSVYRWRGAAVYNVLDFQKHFPKTKIVTLTQNYRSVQPILDHAYQLIQNNNPDRLEIKAKVNKQLVAQRSGKVEGQAIRVIWKERVEDEAERVVEEIENLIQHPMLNNKHRMLEEEKHRMLYRDIAILVRANNHAEPFVRALSRHGIPYQFLGPGKLFRQPEIKDLMAYLKVLDNLEDNYALYRILSMPFLGLSGRDIVWFITQSKKTNSPLFRVLEKFVKAPDEQDHGFETDAINKVTKFVEMLHRHLDRVNKASPGEILYYFLQDTDQLRKMKDPQSELEAKKIENISAFFNRIKTYETQNPEGNIADFIEYLDFLIQAGESPLASEVDWARNNAVNILTLHSAKGLEFDVVFLVNLVNLRFPTMNRKDQIPLPEVLIKEPAAIGDPHLAEERRLFYVGLTRARKKVYLTGAKFYHEGQSNSLSSARRPKKISPFVLETLWEIEPYLVKNKVQGERLFDIETFSIKKEFAPILRVEDKAVPKINYLSFSRIESFQTCPLHYKLDYILKIPKLPTGALTFGTTIHDTLREVYRLILSKKLDKNPKEVAKKALEIYEQIWAPIGFESKKHEQRYFEQGKQMLQNFIEQDLQKETEIQKLEEQFVFQLLPDLKIGGRIDRIDLLPDGKYEIIDYKTGQKPKERELKKGLKSLQLSVYALAATHPELFDFPLDKVLLSFYYLESGEKISFTKTVGDLNQAKEQIIKIREEMEASNFKCNNSYICQRGCDYALFCLSLFKSPGLN